VRLLGGGAVSPLLSTTVSISVVSFEGYCQLELILARLDVSDKQETTVYSAFLSEGSRVMAEISLKLTKPPAWMRVKLRSVT
jgi:hypothetical protein